MQMNTYLLTETDSGAGVEREKDEWVGSEVLVQPCIEEAIGVKFLS